MLKCLGPSLWGRFEYILFDERSRLGATPKRAERLWRRYLVNNPRFVALVLVQALGLRHYSLE